jgi:hypothetical protein
MKKLMMTLIAMVTMTFSAQAMSYEQAREQALFLTDKMAYELNLTEDQYEAAYEVNLDYLLGVESQADLYGEYWTRRNLDLSYILLDWQYNAFCAASYFYRPLYWDAGYWHFGIYARYPHRTYFYFGRPHFWYTYRGGHAWHRVGGRGYYHGRTFGRAHHSAAGHRGFGMRSGYDRGDYRGRSGHIGGHNQGRVGGRGQGRIENRSHGNIERGRSGNYNRRDNGNINRGRSGDLNRRENGSFNRGGSSDINRSRSYNHESSTRHTVGADRGISRSSSSMSRGSNAPSRSFGSGSSSSRSFSHSSAPSRSYGSSSSGRSFGGGSSSSSRSFSGGGSRGGGSFSGGGHGGHGGHGGGHGGRR